MAASMGVPSVSLDVAIATILAVGDSTPGENMARKVSSDWQLSELLADILSPELKAAMQDDTP